MTTHSHDPDAPLPSPKKLARKDEVGADAFGALDLRAGRVVAVEEFPEARKPAYKLTVDFGFAVGRLNTSAQLTNYRPDELMDRLVVGAINLGNKRIAGFTSECLVLGSFDADGTVRLLGLEDSVEPGALIG